MKIKITALAVVLIAALVLFASNFHLGIAYNKEKVITQLVYTGLQKWHYTEKKLDNNFSDKVFNEFIETLDPGKRFFLKSDIDELRKYKDKIAQQLPEGKNDIIAPTMEILDKRVHEVMDFYGSLLAKPLDFSKPETVEFDPKKLNFCSNINALKEYWRKTLKYYTLLRYIDKLEDKTKDAKKNSAELEDESRKAVLKNFKFIFSRLLQGNKNDALSRYINSVLQVYDPHSLYFPPVDKESFDMEMSGSFEGIGATLQNEDEYVKIVQIVPGGPAWRQKQIQTGDLIIKVAQDNDEPVDIIGMRTQEAVKFIRGKKGTLVRLWVKKPDGRIIIVPIIRDVVVLEETFAKSAILTDGNSNQRIGYIELPGFYDDFKGDEGRNSTHDIQKELEKLKAQKVSGIILDLRNNTGGALQDAVDMAGLFISKGPIVQVKDRKNKILVLEDKDPSITYPGPLIVLVNHLSASASEILSAALQDYNRALIVGTNTYGKGTVQAMLNLDRLVYDIPGNDRELGALTLTIQQFYRVNGSAIQIKGVTPDIPLPDRLDSITIGEKYLANALKWNAIPAAVYPKWQASSLASQSLIDQSHSRTQASPEFALLKQYIAKIKSARETTVQNLQLSEVLKQRDQNRKENETIEKAEKESTRITVTPSAEPEKKGSAGLEKIARETRDEWFKEIRRDLSLGETVAIMNDLIALQKKK
ncbi:MAG: carboxy terminal-processing peptidase [Candidatus Omnitrophota bacterium]